MFSQTLNPNHVNDDDTEMEPAMFALTEAPERYTDTDISNWAALARCATGTGTMLDLFFSEQIDDINRAKAFCLGCEVRETCLDAAIDNIEPWGVWGGELLLNGKILAEKRRRGRPPKVRPAEPAAIVDPFEGLFGAVSQSLSA